MQILQKTAWRILKKLRLELPFDPAISLLVIYLKKIKLYAEEIPMLPCPFHH